MTRILILCILALFLQGCPFAAVTLPVAGVSATIVAAGFKHKWHKDEVMRTEAFREAVLDGFDDINKKLEESTNEMRRMQSGDDT